MPIASPYDAITGTASRICSAAAPSMTMPLRDSRPWIDISGETTNAPPPRRIIAAWNDVSVRSDGLRNRSDSTLPSSARGPGCRSRRRARSISPRISSLEKSARSLKRCIADLLERGSEQLDVLPLENERRQEPDDVRIRARADQDVPLEQRVADFRRGGRRLQSEQEALSLHAVHRADDAGLADERGQLSDVVDQPFLLDRLDRGDDRRARERSA